MRLGETSFNSERFNLRARFNSLLVPFRPRFKPLPRLLELFEPVLRRRLEPPEVLFSISYDPILIIYGEIIFFEFKKILRILK